MPSSETQFKPGQSGNPAGGQLHKRYQLHKIVEELDAKHKCKHIDEIVETIVTKAREGDMQAATIVADRLFPKIKPRALPAILPQLDPNGSVTDAAKSILGALASGQLDTEQSANVMRALSDYARIEEFDELKREILELKEMYLRDKR